MQICNFDLRLSRECPESATGLNENHPEFDERLTSGDYRAISAEIQSRDNLETVLKQT